MICKMKNYYVIYVFLVILFCKDCFACFQEDSEYERSITTGNTFYEECCCTDENYSTKGLKWLDPDNAVIGPGTDSNVYTEDQGEECISLHIRSSSIPLSGAYRCVSDSSGVSYTQTYNLYVYDPLYFLNVTSLNQYLIYGKDSMIHCEAQGASTPRFKWTRGEDGQEELFNSEKYQLEPEGLIVKNVNDEDAGIYRCSASVMSTGEELERDIDVKVMTAPLITQLKASPEDTVTEKESLVIQCQADGYPYPEYVWTKVELKPENETRNVTWRQNGNSIIFDFIEAEDGGTYECFAKNFVGNDSKTIEIKVLVAPQIIDFTNKTVVEGTEIVMICNATGIPPPNITITYEGKSLENMNSIYTQFVNNYSILKVDRSKEGIYICNATNEVDFETEIIYMTVQHPPSFDNKLETVWGWIGEDAHLYCNPEANPPATIKWRYLTTEIEDQNITQFLPNFDPYAENNTIRVSESYAPYGVFECTATNILGEAIKVFDFKQGYKPSRVINASVDEVLPTSAFFSIEAPTDFIGPEVLGFMAEYDTDESYTITNIHINRTWAKDIPYKLEGLKPNTTYIIRFAAINRVGTGNWSESIEFQTLEKSAPEPPILLTDAFQPSTSNVLKWKEPEDNGAPIDSYMLRYCPADESLGIKIAECTSKRVVGATELELTNLEYNTTYYFEIIAHNTIGDSLPANYSLLVPALVEAEPTSLLSGGAIIGISIVIVLVCLLLLDVLLLVWRRQGIIASCCFKKNKKKPNALHSRDKKGLLKDNGESTDDTLRRPNNGHREYEYNKTTGIITGKHSSV